MRNQLGFRFACLGDDNLFAGGGAVDQLGEVRLRIVNVDGLSHRRTGATSEELIRLTNK
jgi:hypothetical protein